MKRFLVAQLFIVAALAVAPTAHAEGAGGASVIPCADVFGGTGNLVVTPVKSHVNANCNGPGPAQGGGAVVERCSEIAAGLKGNYLVTPSGHNQVHCS